MLRLRDCPKSIAAKRSHRLTKAEPSLSFLHLPLQHGPTAWRIAQHKVAAIRGQFFNGLKVPPGSTTTARTGSRSGTERSFPACRRVDRRSVLIDRDGLWSELTDQYDSVLASAVQEEISRQWMHATRFLAHEHESDEHP